MSLISWAGESTFFSWADMYGRSGTFGAAFSPTQSSSSLTKP